MYTPGNEKYDKLTMKVAVEILGYKIKEPVEGQNLKLIHNKSLLFGFQGLQSIDIWVWEMIL